MNDLAREALGRVIKNYGPSICQTPRSAELFVRQECAAYPNESRLLVEALRHGVIEELTKYNPTDRPWDQFSGDLQHTLQSRAGLNEAEGTWAVDTWARVLGRHPDEIAAAPEVVAAPTPGGTVSLATFKRIMMIIVTGGGALGGATGALIIPAALLLTTTPAEIALIQRMTGGVPKKDIWMVISLFLLFAAAVGGVGGAIGAAAGWWHGRGDRNPWGAALAAFGGAFTAAAIASRVGGVIGALFASFFGAFGGARAMASRGGYG